MEQKPFLPLNEALATGHSLGLETFDRLRMSAGFINMLRNCVIICCIAASIVRGEPFSAKSDIDKFLGGTAFGAAGMLVGGGLGALIGTKGAGLPDVNAMFIGAGTGYIVLNSLGVRFGGRLNNENGSYLSALLGESLGATVSAVSIYLLSEKLNVKGTLYIGGALIFTIPTISGIVAWNAFR